MPPLSLTVVPNTFAMSGTIGDGYPRWRGTMDMGSAECVYTHLPWTAISTYPEGLLGWVTSSGATDVVLMMPHACPNWPDLFCTELAFDPVGKQTGHFPPQGAGYEYAQITAIYETAPKNPLEMIVDERITPAAEFLTLPNTSLFWDAPGVDDPLADVEAPSKLITLWEWEYTIRRLPEECLPANIYDHVGKINTAAMTSHKFGFTFAEGRVLYGNVVIEDGLNWWGDRYYTVFYKFLVRAYSWQLFYRGGFDTPQILYEPAAGGAFATYGEADLTDLIFVD